MVKEASNLVLDKPAILGALDVACARFEKQLQNNPRALNYLMNERGLTDSTIQQFRIGYAPNDWNFLSNQRFVEDEGYSLEILEKAGLIARSQEKNNIYDRFRGRITLPIFDYDGRVISFTARIFEAESQDEKKGAKYINGPQTVVYEKGKTLYGLNLTRKNIAESGKVIIVEGGFDLLQPYQNGFENIGAPCGTALTSEQINALDRITPGLEKIIAFDGDEPGRRNAERICEEHLDHSLKVAIFPEGLDPDGYIRKYGPESFSKIIENSLGGLEFLVRRKLGDDFNGKIDSLQKISSSSAEEKISLLSYLELAFKGLSEKNRGIYSTEIGKMIDLPKEDVESFFYSSSNALDSNYVSQGGNVFWQSQLVRILLSLASQRSNQNTGLKDMLDQCNNFHVRDLLKMPEAKAVYDCLNERSRDLPLAQVGTDLFGGQANSEIFKMVRKYTKKELDPDILSSLFDVSQIAYPIDQRMKGLNHSLFEWAVMELTLRQLRADIKAGFREKKYSLNSISKLGEKIRNGKINDEKRSE